MLNLNAKADIDESKIKGHVLRFIEIKQDKVYEFADILISIIPHHYIAPKSIAATLERLGKPAAAEKLRLKLPQTSKIRSGDLGEILATAYIEEYTRFSVPIKKLRWRDHREMAMRGDDVIGIESDPEDNSLRFLKAEAKSRASLSMLTMEQARKGLDSDDGKPAPHALAFIADRLRESGKQRLADQIENVLLTNGVDNRQVEHLLFTFTGSNPRNLQEKTLRRYGGSITQKGVGLRVRNHQEFIASVYEGVLKDGLDD